MKLPGSSVGDDGGTDIGFKANAPFVWSGVHFSLNLPQAQHLLGGQLGGHSHFVHVDEHLLPILCFFCCSNIYYKLLSIINTNTLNLCDNLHMCFFVK